MTQRFIHVLILLMKFIGHCQSMLIGHLLGFYTKKNKLTVNIPETNCMLLSSKPLITEQDLNSETYGAKTEQTKSVKTFRD